MSEHALRSGTDPENRIEPVLQQYASFLSGRGYAANSVREGVRVVEHFSRWLGRRPLSRAAVQKFLRRHLPICRCQKPVIRNPRRNDMALHRLLAMIEPPAETGRSEVPRGFAGSLLRRYQEHLIGVRGLTAGTVRNRIRSARTMLTRMGTRRASQFSAWTPERIENYVAAEARRHQPGTTGSVTSASRSFLRFLLQEGLIQRDLADAVPKFAQWGLAALPKTLRDDELERLLNGPPANTPIGLRDRAILLCMSELGLRAAEVTFQTLFGLLASTGLRISEALRLPLGRVDLDRGVLQIERTKFKKSRLVPLHPTATRALRRYAAERVRLWGKDESKPFFVGSLGSALSDWVARDAFRTLCTDLGWQRGNGDWPRPRIHDLRHSFACRCLLRWCREGENVHHRIAALSTYLGHVCVTNTYWYLTATPELLGIAASRFEQFATSVEGRQP